ncbi:CatA-like O-acetyltransferase [Ferrimonas marina]|uniref:Chloramphenicol O-acetyltransferase type A n=1 Tax=Ferrimonas marina TaxID=299255 RepID=A0A1M5X5F5_9GAMM|nr:CatA-like O-acetyltransferase [Ferrimonas marina]SHH95057.1 chloramphenicol O-acetyltransferase type A [Ferrimonas marina]
MIYLDMAQWPRRQQFDFFRSLGCPYFSFCAEVPVQPLLDYCQRERLSAYRAITYAMLLTANELPWMRWRIRGEQVVEHPSLNAGLTALGQDGQVRFSRTPWSETFAEFDAQLEHNQREASASDTLFNQGHCNGDTDADLYLSCVPWLRFTQYNNPMPLNPVDSVPRIVWGKYGDSADGKTIPVVIQAHHALADGLHLAQFYQVLERHCQQPQSWLQ